MNYKSFATEFKVNSEKREVEAYASVFDNIDAGRDRVRAGAFKKTLMEDAQRKNGRIKALMHHTPTRPVGRPKSIIEDSTGLLTVTPISKTSDGNDLIELLNDGVISELSIGYNTIKDAYDSVENVRDLVEIKLWEYSFVTWGMNELAQVQGVKSLDDLWNYIDVVYEAKKEAKAGRVLSEKNRGLVKQAVEALQSLLSITEPGDDSTSDGKGADHSTDDDDQAGDTHLDEIKAFAESLETEAMLRELARGF